MKRRATTPWPFWTALSQKHDRVGPMSHFLSIGDLSREEVLHLFRLTASLKARQKAGDRRTPLAGPPPGRGVDITPARTYRHATVEALAAHATVPVINGLSDLEHPCQALADFFTLWERGMDLGRIRLAWIGDGNNVCHSLLLLAALLGTPLSVATPPGYAPHPAIQARARDLGGRPTLTTDPREAVEGADVVYTDVWISMGQEAEREQRLRAVARHQRHEH